MDVVIPCSLDDIPMLRLCIEGLRRNVNEIGKIIVIGKDCSPFRMFCKKNWLFFVDEVEFMGYGKDDINICRPRRAGWLYQQLIKLNAANLVQSDNFLVMDADHVLLKPHTFISDGKWNFYTSEEYHKPYFLAINNLFNGKYDKICEKSFISDKMVFNKSMLAAMKDEIEKCCKESWDKAIINNYVNSNSGFSEFETYGTWVYSNYKDKCQLYRDGRCRVQKKENIRTMTYNEIGYRFNGYMSITELKL